jgi:FK506-binding protein 2
LLAARSSKEMRTFDLLIVLVVALLLSQEAFGFKKGDKGISKAKMDEKKQPLKKTEEIKIDVTYRPDKCERKSKNGDTLTMEYTGMLQDTGSVFDSSKGRAPFTFKLGAGQVIMGWEKGLQGMCAGEKRKLTIPPQYAYGDAGHPPVIPPSSTLVFDVELVKIT